MLKNISNSLHTNCQSHNSYTCHKAKGSPLPPTLINVRCQEQCKCAYHKAKAHLFLLNLHQDIHTSWFPECTHKRMYNRKPHTLHHPNPRTFLKGKQTLDFGNVFNYLCASLKPLLLQSG